MKRSLAIFDDCRAAVRVKVNQPFGALIAANLLAWVWAVAAFHKHQLLLGTASLLTPSRNLDRVTRTDRRYGAGGEEMATSSLHVIDGVP
ncbi:MAG: hypothetical protein JO229_00435 [Alphaproteobacteria bacterium]|nr:hypothetical protein [Alphaproteobacteria bacterium]